MEPSLKKILEQEEKVIALIDKQGATPALIHRFQKHLYQYYDTYGRELPWRGTHITPYQVYLSEVMLQQTQVDRVKDKYLQFIATFPTFSALAQSSLNEVLACWSGLGYNRRALMLHKAARMVMDAYGGELPSAPDQLITLPGIGPATSASIAAFGFNLPTVFIETNIRSVILHFFFNDKDDISDEQIVPLAEKILDQKHACRWYSALMDYGSELKKRAPNPSRRSRHYVKQSKFVGSDRQIRGKIIRFLLVEKRACAVTIYKAVKVDTARGRDILSKMVKEEMLCKEGRFFNIA